MMPWLTEEKDRTWTRNRKRKWCHCSRRRNEEEGDLVKNPLLSRVKSRKERLLFLWMHRMNSRDSLLPVSDSVLNHPQDGFFSFPFPPQVLHWMNNIRDITRWRGRLWSSFSLWWRSSLASTRNSLPSELGEYWSISTSHVISCTWNWTPEEDFWMFWLHHSLPYHV
jgi:hypothetical protein